jgi:hypothetical protein
MNISQEEFRELFPLDRPSQFIVITENAVVRKVIDCAFFEETYDALDNFDYEKDGEFRKRFDIKDKLPIFVAKNLLGSDLRFKIVSRAIGYTGGVGYGSII